MKTGKLIQKNIFEDSILKPIDYDESEAYWFLIEKISLQVIDKIWIIRIGMN